MQLGKSVLPGVFDDHDGRGGHVQANLDHGGRDQHLNLTRVEFGHDLLAGCGIDSAVQQTHAVRLHQLTQAIVLFADRLEAPFRGVLFDAGIYHIGLATSGELVVNEAPYLRKFIRGAQVRAHLPAPGRQFIQHGHIEVAVGREPEGARNGRRGHHQQVWVEALANEFFPLHHAEPVLLIDDHQAQSLGLITFVDERVRADRQRCLFSVRRGADVARVKGDGHVQFLEPVAEPGEMLLGEDLGWCHERDPKARFDGHQCGTGSDHRLAAADIAMQESAHRVVSLQVGANFTQHLGLRRRELELELLKKGFDQLIVPATRLPLGLFAKGRPPGCKTPL